MKSIGETKRQALCADLRKFALTGKPLLKELIAKHGVTQSTVSKYASIVIKEVQTEAQVMKSAKYSWNPENELIKYTTPEAYKIKQPNG